MPRIELSTSILAPVDRVFDLSRSIDLHTVSAAASGEQAIDGVTSGLIGANDEVTWRAKHFGSWHTLTVRITEYDRPNHFRDVMTRGIFKRMAHDHFFDPVEDGTLMRDVFDFESPFGALGQVADLMFLSGYMRSFLLARNQIIKDTAESTEWAKYVGGAAS